MTERLFRPVDIASLIWFRIAFGAIMFWEVCRYFKFDWISRYWIEPELHFSYYGFGFLEPLPGVGMYILWIALGLLALLISVGKWYRFAATLFFLGFTYSFLLEQARYLNHFYLVSLISFLMVFLPAHRGGSLDVIGHPHRGYFLWKNEIFDETCKDARCLALGRSFHASDPMNFTEQIMVQSTVETVQEYLEDLWADIWYRRGSGTFIHRNQGKKRYGYGGQCTTFISI